jgi:hypothetical protein
VCLHGSSSANTAVSDSTAGAPYLEPSCAPPLLSADPHLLDLHLSFARPDARAQVLRCCLENATSVARTFLMADCIVTEIPELEDPAAAGAPGGMEMGGY